MKLIVNDKELAYYLISLVDIKKHLSHIQIDESNTSNVAGIMGYILNKKESPKFELEKFRQKFKDKISNAVTNDLNNWQHDIKLAIKQIRTVRIKNIQNNAAYIIEKLGEESVIKNYLNSDNIHFIKTVGQQLDPNAEMIRRKRFSDATQDCLLRNTVGNGTILVDKIDNNHPFWFIDSGYTNFLESNKKWHRLVRNHLHFNNDFNAPSDRLKLFPSFPKPWRKTGSKILIVEPGPFAASIFHVDHKTWGQQVADELRKYTDRPIEFRPKVEKKTRTSLYQKLMTEDYYCTVSINSNSAVESIWAGIPAITLDKHVSNSVTVNKLEDIDKLYYGPLGNWLSWLSYSQFTFDELMDGTALNIIRNQHGVTD
jgi:ribosomal protein L31